MGVSAPPVRRAGPSDVRALAAVLARAFHDDPVMSWVFAREATRPAWIRRYFRTRLRALLGGGEVYTTGDAAGAALWAPPEGWRFSLWETVALARFLPATGRRTARVLRGLEGVEHRHPETPHWYLAVLGTEPERQGEGIGSAVLAPMLEACDADEIPAYLESSKERNVAFYARHGFRVTEEVRLPGGPPLWLMWRDPRP
ncbi:MAG: GNAT family N-acetyltransferase [Thermoleophilaceae bacterium]